MIEMSSMASRHTTNSVDAILFNTLNTPRDAYRFAQREPIGLPPYDAQGNPRRTIQLFYMPKPGSGIGDRCTMEGA